MVESATLPPGTIHLPPETVREFLAAALRAADVPEADAGLTADVLISADLRGVRSHGAARLQYFMHRLAGGVINTRPDMRFVAGSDTTGTLDADNGLGTVAANRAMDEALACARRHGCGFVAVANSNHFGFAGYWSHKAMERGYIGVSMSNGGRRVAPTFGASPVFGTNPFSIAIPGGPGVHDFHLDMATSAVAVGKIETALREGRPVPKGWVSEADGAPRLDERGILVHDMPLLPLGGAGDQTGGHKGYGLSLMVELLSSVLAGADLEQRLAGADGSSRAATGHFLGALDPAGFREPALIFASIASTFDAVRSGRKDPGRERIYIHGEPEAIAEETHRRLGIPITPAVLEQLRGLDARFGLGFAL